MKPRRCAIYTRVSTDNGLEQEFNSLHAQREAAQAYIKSQAHEGWKLIRDPYDDGGFSGGSLERPGLQKLLADIRERRIDIVVVYKVDRLTRPLTDFAKLVELFDGHGVAFVSVTQSFNTTSGMGRLTLCRSTAKNPRATRIFASGRSVFCRSCLSGSRGQQALLQLPLFCPRKSDAALPTERPPHRGPGAFYQERT